MLVVGILDLIYLQPVSVSKLGQDCRQGLDRPEFAIGSVLENFLGRQREMILLESQME